MEEVLQTVKTQKAFDDALEEQGRNLTVVHFWADWAEQCKQMNDVLKELARQYPNVKYLLIEAEELPDVTVSYEVEAVPTFLFLKNKQQIGRLNGAHAPELTKMVKEHLNTPAPSSNPEELLQKKLRSLVISDECMLFMKGNREAVKCGFSSKMIQLLDSYDCAYSTFDILEDPEVRQGLKKFSEWPTFPQLYVKGNFVGGLDIVTEMHKDNELKEILPTKEDANKKLDNRIKEIINQSPTVVIMKGQPDSPKCGFSRQLVQILAEVKATYTHFDIFTDEAIRQRIKIFSDWPTFPQVYVGGEFIGGLDIIKEMKQNGELVEALSVK